MRNIVIHGFYGMGNLGDEAILTSIAHQFSRENTHITVFSKNPSRVLSDHNLKAVHENRGILPYFERRKIIKQSDLFLLGGGGIIKDFGRDSRLLKKWFNNIMMAGRFSIKTVLFAIGVENILYKESKRFLKHTLEKIDIISVRDALSKNKLEEMGIRTSIITIADPALMLGTDRDVHVKTISDNAAILVCLRHWFRQGFFVDDMHFYSKVITSLQKALTWFIDTHNARIIFIPFRTISHDNDNIVNQEVASGIQKKNNITILKNVPSVHEYLTMAEQGDIIIGMRFHSLILGAATGTPVIGLEYMPKVRGFMQELQQKENSIDLKTIKAAHIISRGTHIMNHYTDISKKIIKRVTMLREINRGFINQLLV